ncbi:MAG: cell envelope integrity protein CreD [Candidatus Binatia bacterium]
MDNQVSTIPAFFKNAPLLRVLLLGFLLLLLQIPIDMVQGLTSEREARRDQAVEEVTAKWGKEQSLIGPVIVVPYVRRIEESRNGEKKVHTTPYHAYFLPEELVVDGQIHSEVRQRGIFEVPVYRASLVMKGRFSRPLFSDWDINPDDVAWDRAQLFVRISDVRAIQNMAALQWNGNELPFLPGTGDFGGGSPGIHASLKDHVRDEQFTFSLPFELNGSMGIFFAPSGRNTTVNLQANWSDPSFQGNWLPSNRTVTPKGFHATWTIPALGHNFPRRWTSESGLVKVDTAPQFGVTLVSLVDHYRMAQRSIKYEHLFLVLTFLSLWLFEVLVKIRIHPLQYVLVGAGMCLFYLLELSLAEHLGFIAAYVIASAAVVGLITTYCVAVVQTVSRAAIIGAVVTALYGYLYVLLLNEDYALLVGSIGLFLTLAMVMYLTRKVDWYGAPETVP